MAELKIPNFFYSEPEKKFAPYPPQVFIWRAIVFFVFTIIGVVFFTITGYAVLLGLELSALISMRVLLTVRLVLIIMNIILAVLFGAFVSRGAIIVTEPYYLASLLFASHKRIRKPGYRLLVPLFEAKVTYIDMRIKQMVIPDTTALTTDPAPMKTDINLRLGVSKEHPEIAVWGVEDFSEVARRAAEGVIYSYIMQSNMDSLRQKAAKIRAESELQEKMVAEAPKIGARIDESGTRTSDFVIADAKILEAVSQVLEARFLSEAKITLAEAETATMRKLLESLKGVLPEDVDADTLARAVLFLRQQQTLTQIASQGGFTPLADFSGMLSQTDMMPDRNKSGGGARKKK